MYPIDVQQELLISGMSDEKCCLFEFTNESDSVEVGFSCWIQTSSNTEDRINIQELISDKTEIVLFWPSNIDVTYASGMVKRCKKNNLQWIKVSAILLAHGNWVDMCAKRNYYISHAKTSPCRSKRHERHILSESTVTDKNKTVKTTNTSATKRKKYAELSSSSILKKLNNKKVAVEPYRSNYEDHKTDKLEPKKYVANSSDDENLTFPLSKLSKDDLIIKVKMLELKNKDLRTTISKQRVMIDTSESFPRIHELSNLVIKNLESVISMTEKQTISISASLKARANMSSESVVSKMTTNNLVKQNVCNVANVDFCYKMSPELVSNQPSNILKDSKEIQKAILIETATVLEDIASSAIDKSKDSNEIQKAAVLENITSSAIDQSKTVSSENWVELWPKSGIEVNSFALSSINRISPSKMISDLMVIVFTDDELRNGSVTGKKSNFIKGDGELKKKLDSQKVKAIKDFTQDIFKDVTEEIMNKALRTKLNNFSKKQKTLDFNAGSAARLSINNI